MPVHKPLPILGAVLVLALSVTARQQSAMSEEDYEKTMTEIQALVGDANQHIDSAYWPDVREDMQKIQTQLGAVEEFWTARGTKAAVGFARAAIQAIRPVEVAAGRQDGEAARSALSSLQGACQTCHKQFREKAADGFRIKP